MNDELIFTPKVKEAIKYSSSSYLCKQIISDYFEHCVKNTMFVHPYEVEKRIPDFCKEDFKKIVKE